MRFSLAGTIWNFCGAAVDAALRLLCSSVVVGRHVMLPTLTVSTTFVLACYTKSVVVERHCATGVPQIVFIELASRALVRFLHGAERVIFLFQCCDPQMAQDGFAVLVSLSSGTGGGVSHYGSA